MKTHVTFCLCLSIPILTWQIHKKWWIPWISWCYYYTDWTVNRCLFDLQWCCIESAPLVLTTLTSPLFWVCSHLLAFLNALLKFQACQMPAPASLLSICQSQACTPHLPPAESQVHWPWHLFHTAPLPFLHWDYKSQVEDHNFVPLLWMNYCILKLLDVEFCHTASRCRLDPPLP